jgi:starvation-inducible DNA-binding protein
MTTRTRSGGKETFEGQPRLKQRLYEIQQYERLRDLPIELTEEARRQSVNMLNQLLADAITLYHLYKKHHWQVSGPTFYQLHLLFDKHAEEILQSVDLIGERIQMLGGVALGMPFDVAETTRIARPPKGSESVPSMLARLVEAHHVLIKEIRSGIKLTEQNHDYGTNDMLMSDLLRMHEMHVWFISQHLVDTPLIGEDNTAG